MDPSTIMTLIFGGIVLGVSGVALLYFTGYTLGISGIIEGCLVPWNGKQKWAIVFILGLLTGSLILSYIYPLALDFQFKFPLPVYFFTGCLVGLGARLGGGCTTGHGISGVGRLLPRSIVGTVIFIAVGMIAATILGRLV